MGATSGGSQTRIDKWLWAVRLFKTRTAAGDACATGKVRINGEQAKAARRVVPGDEVVVRRRGYKTTYRVIRVIEKRVGADTAVDCYEDLTPDDERPQPRRRTGASDLRIDAAWAERERGSGRPTKRDRRQMDKFLRRGRKS